MLPYRTVVPNIISGGIGLYEAGNEGINLQYQVKSTETRHLNFAGLSPSDFDPNAKSTYLDETLVGFEFEPVTNLNVGARWVHRRFGRILEDVGTVPMVGFLLPGGGDSVEYFITNPGPNTPVVPIEGFDISFEDAIHEYDALEFTADKRFGNNWGLQASYRWSRLHGTFEGFFRHTDYAVKLGGPRRVVLLADMFNLFNVQRATGYDQDTESSFGALNPDYGQPVIARVPQFQTPFQLRLGARFEF